MDDGVPQLPSKFLVHLVLIPICWFPFHCLNHENELYLPVFYFLTLFYSLFTHSSHHYAKKNYSFSDREKSVCVTAGSNISNFQISETFIMNFEFSFKKTQEPMHFFAEFFLIFDQPCTGCGWGRRQRNVTTISSEIFDISLQKAGRWGFTLL